MACGAELLRKSAEHVLTELVQRVFTRLVSIPPDSEQDQVLASLEPPALVRHLLLPIAPLLTRATRAPHSLALLPYQ